VARIKGVTSARAGLFVKIAYYFSRRSIGKLTGRQTDRMIEPLEIYAHVPVLFKGYAKLEQATAKLHRLDKRLHALAELKAATLTHCEFCIDMGSVISRRWGLTDEELLDLPGYQTSPLFSELDKLVLDYAVEQGNPADGPQLAPAIGRVIRRTGKKPRTVTADRGYGEQLIEEGLRALGVRHVAIPRKGKPGKARQAAERRPAFRRAVKWRTGSEGRISALKRQYGWDRTRLDGTEGAQTWTGYGILAHTTWSR